MKKFLRLQRPANKRPGFSLIELLVVIALIAILTSLTMSSTNFLSRMMVRAELEHLYGVCYFLQRKAIMTHTPQHLVCDPELNTYTINGTTYRLPAQVMFGAARGVKGPPATPRAFIERAITFPSHTITFHPEGIIQAGAIYFTNTKRTCTYALSCGVSPVSYLRKYQYTNAWHMIS